MSIRNLGNLVCRLATAADRKALIPALARSYLHEPTVADTDVSMRECEAISDLVLEATLPEGHTFVIEDPAGRIASFTLSGDFGSLLPDDHPILRYIAAHRHFSVVGKLEDHLEEKYAAMSGFPRDAFPMGHTMHIRMGGTEPDFRNRRLNSATFDALISHCRERGFKYIMSNSTSLYTRRMSERQRMFAWATERYEDWYPKGSVYTRCVRDGHDAVQLMVLDMAEYDAFHGIS